MPRRRKIGAVEELAQFVMAGAAPPFRCRQQSLQALLRGKRLAHRGGCLGRKHVPVPRRRQFRGKRLQACVCLGNFRGCQRAAENLDRGAKPANGNAHLVHRLRPIASGRRMRRKLDDHVAQVTNAWAKRLGHRRPSGSSGAPSRRGGPVTPVATAKASAARLTGGTAMQRSPVSASASACTGADRRLPAEPVDAVFGRRRANLAVQQRHADRALLRNKAELALSRPSSAAMGNSEPAARGQARRGPAGRKHRCAGAGRPGMRIGSQPFQPPLGRLLRQREPLLRQGAIWAVVPDDLHRAAARLAALQRREQLPAGSVAGHRPGRDAAPAPCVQIADSARVAGRQEPHQPGAPGIELLASAWQPRIPRAQQWESRRAAAAWSRCRRNCAASSTGQLVHARIVANQHDAAHGLIHFAQDREQLRRASRGRASPHVSTSGVSSHGSSAASVSCMRRAGETSTMSGVSPRSSIAWRMAPAARRPRLFNGRSRSASFGSSHDDLAWRRSRSWCMRQQIRAGRRRSCHGRALANGACRAGLRGAGRRRAGSDLDRLRQLLAGGIARQVGALRQRQHLGENADILLAEQRALPDAALRLGVRQAGDVVVVLALRAAAEGADEIGVQRAFLRHQFAAEALDEVVVAILLVAGERGHHQLALEAGNVECRHVGGLGAWLGARRSPRTAGRRRAAPNRDAHVNPPE